MKAHCKKLNLCDSCIHHVAECGANNITFGDGKGNDNVIDCDCFNNADKPIVCPVDCNDCYV